MSGPNDINFCPCSIANDVPPDKRVGVLCEKRDKIRFLSDKKKSLNGVQGPIIEINYLTVSVL